MFKFMLAFLALFLFAGCANDEVEVAIDETLPVTVYFAIEDQFCANEWLSFITITINSDDIVTDVTLDGVTRFANHSRREFAQLDGFENILEYNFYEQATSLEATLVGIFRSELVDTIQDAYENGIVDFDTTTFANLASRALTGSSTLLERGPYIDGSYRSISHINEDGLQYFVNLFIINGNIVAIHFNAIIGDELKYNPFNDTTVSEEIIAWRSQIQLLEQALLSLQDPTAFTFCEDGFTTDIPGIEIEIESFTSLVIQALTTGLITN